MLVAAVNALIEDAENAVVEFRNGNGVRYTYPLTPTAVAVLRTHNTPCF
jgi:hypothetical protein